MQILHSTTSHKTSKSQTTPQSFKLWLYYTCPECKEDNEISFSLAKRSKCVECVYCECVYDITPVLNINFSYEEINNQENLQQYQKNKKYLLDLGYSSIDIDRLGGYNYSIEEMVEMLNEAKPP